MKQEGSRVIGRRRAVYQMLFGAGLVGLRSLASGVPASVLLNPRRAMAAAPDGGAADAGVPAITNPQFVIYSTSSNGDPVNCNAPGTYDDPKIYHPGDPSMASTPMTFGSRTVNGAKIWSTLGPSVLAQTSFFHHGTYTIIHPDEVKVLGLLGQVASGEMLCSFLSRELSTALGTVRPQPLSLGGNGAGEAIFYQGQPQAFLTPTTLASVLAPPSNGLGAANLVALRDQTLDSLNAYARSMGNTAQKNFIDQYATSVIAAPHAAAWPPRQPERHQGRLAGLADPGRAHSLSDEGDARCRGARELRRRQSWRHGARERDCGSHVGSREHRQDDAGHRVGQSAEPGDLRDVERLRADDGQRLQRQRAPAQRPAPRHGDDRAGNQRERHRRADAGGGSGARGRFGEQRVRGAAHRFVDRARIVLGGDIVYGETMASMGRTLAAAVGIPASVISQNILSGTVVKPALAS